MECKGWQVLETQEIRELETRQVSSQERSRWHLKLHWVRTLLLQGSFHFLQGGRK